MAIYWFMLSFPFLLAFYFPDKKVPNIIWWFLLIIFSLFIGLRHDISPDWISYLGIYETLEAHSFAYVAKYPVEFGYGTLNWFSAQFGGGLHFVNLICGIFLVFGAISFSKQQPYPALAFYIFVPYVILVIGMGFTRQAAALGLMLWVVSKIQVLPGSSKKNETSILYLMVIIGLASTFHKSALLFFPLWFLTTQKYGLMQRISIAVPVLLVALLFSGGGDYVSDKWSAYVDESMQAKGALIRVMMNAIPSMIFMVMWRKFQEQLGEHFWYYFVIAAVSLAILPLVAVAPAAVDRLAFYFIPIQVIVFSRMYLFFSVGYVRTTLVVFILFYYTLVWFVWSNFSTFSFRWVPYQNWFFL